jgi:flagellar hook-associated protein 1 FlgK
MLARLGADLKFHEGRHEAAATVADDFLERRDQIAGVSQDEETADMIRYQKSYEAAARLMTVLDDILDVLINRMGRVGL